jgi:Polyketide cyclase / dehydrase and lipid transport
MAEIGYGAVVPLPPDEAFAFVSDPTTWPRFFDTLESAEPLDEWGTVGGRGRMTTRFLGSSVTSELELTEWDPPRIFRYTARQAGRPDLDNLRVFTPVGTGTQLRGSTTIRPRPGLRGLMDRVTLQVLARVYGKAMRRLPTVAGGTADPR